MCVSGFIDIRQGGSKPLHKEGVDNGKRPLTSQHGCGDACNLGNLEHTHTM